MALLDYAWTERYVVPGGAGSQTGADWANAFSETGMVADLAQGRRYNLAGSFTPSATINVSGTSGTSTNPIAFRGWKADKSAPADSLDDLAGISGAGHTGTVLQVGNHHIFQGLDVHSGAGYGIRALSTSNCYFDLCKARSNASYGMLLFAYNKISRSKIYGNGGTGFYASYGTSIDSCEFYNNGTTYNCSFNSGSGISITRSYFSGSSNGIYFGSEQPNVKIAYCTIDGATTGLYMTTQNTNSNIMLIGNQFTNNEQAFSSYRSNILLHNNFYGNTYDVFAKSGNTFVDPQYVDIANHNYEIQNSSLIGVSIPGVQGSVNIGAWQYGSGGSSGGGLKTHPGMAGGVNG